ncbi:MAG: TRAP transporter small permease subunit [Elusimicrobia bacterium]|nr:TRAP transporter small permease subunit [Elusimicrobiota bacterium]
MKLLLSADDALARAEKAVLVALVCAMLALSALQVVLRLAFSTGILWADPLLRHMVLWAGLAGAALAAHESKHFVLDLAERLLPQGLRQPLAVFSGLVSAFICALLLYASIKFLRDEHAAATTAFSMFGLNIQSFWVEAALAPAFALIMFHSIAGFFRRKQ